MMAYDAAARPKPDLLSIEAEQAVLGAILFDNAVLARIAPPLTANHFADPLHSLIFDACARLISSGRVAAPTIVATFLESSEGFVEAGGRRYLETVAVNVPSIASAPDFARHVIDLARRRALLKIADDLKARAGDAALDDPPNAILADAQEALDALMLRDSPRAAGVSVRAALADWLDRAATRSETGAALGHLCGLTELDDMLGGFRPGKLYIVAGRPAMGKTTVLNKLATGIARQGEGGGVAISTLEMEAADLPVMMITDALRDRCIRLPYQSAERGLISEAEWPHFMACAREVEALPIIIDDSADASPAHIRAFARQAKKRFAGQGKPMRALIVDYLGLVAKDKRLQNVDAIQAITRELLAIARELDVAVIAGCQLNREVERRDDKRPQLADLRESGAIEQDAFAVIMLFRELYYVERSEPPADKIEKHAAWQTTMLRLRCERPLEMIVAKHRRGAAGTVTVWCEVETAAIRDRGFSTLDPLGADRRGVV